MEETLSKLLEAEDKAQKIIDTALKERDRIVREATEEAHKAEQQFNQRVPEIHRSFMEKAEDRAHHTIAEMERRFKERQSQLQSMAKENHDEALKAALVIVLGRDVD